MDDISETVLVERLKNGDGAALELLMERYASRVFRIARGITRTDADAEEVVQDVFLTLARKIDSFEGRAAVGTWIYRVATNAALIKRRGKRAQLEVSLEENLPTFMQDGHREAREATSWPTGQALRRRSCSTERPAPSSPEPSTSCPRPIGLCSSCVTSKSSPTRRRPGSSASPSPRSSRGSIGRVWRSGSS
mgnify:CR=1 FL=1